MAPSSKCCRVQACPSQYRIPPQLAPNQLQQQKQNTAKPQIVGNTMQMFVHGAPLASVAFCTSVQKFFEITLAIGCTAPHASSCSGKANTQGELSLQQKGPSKFPLRLSLTVHMPYSYLGYVRLPLPSKTTNLSSRIHLATVWLAVSSYL